MGFISICTLILSVVIFFFIMNTFNIVTFGLDGLAGIFLVSIFISIIIVGLCAMFFGWLFSGILFILKWVLIIVGVLFVLALIISAYEKYNKKDASESEESTEQQSEVVE